ncbi:MAG: histidine kinase [Actinomycetota bacterium]|nr:histidine kinase [Actinomycetota bacterium]
MRSLRITAWVVALTTFAIFAGLVLGLAPDLTGDQRFAYALAFVALAPASVGLLIAIRQPRNVIAWILLVGALSAAPWYVFIPDRGWSLQFARAVWPLLYAWAIAVAFVFPNGRLLTRRWRWVAGAAVCSFVAFLSIAMLDNEPFDPPDAAVRSPMAGVHHPGWVNWIWVPFWIGILASLFAGAIAIWLRLRRSTGVERLQTLWLVWAAALVPLGLLSCFAGWGVGVPYADVALFVILMLMPITVAAAVGIAVVRYRLYAIERLVNRTAVYGSLTLLLAATYIGITLAAGVAVGHGSAWVTAAATLVVALSFRPLRARVQSIVDRRFDRARSDGLRTVEAFESDVREGLRAPEEIAGVLAAALRDPLADLVFWLPASETYATSAGELVAELPADGRARSEITREGARTAVLLHDPALLDRPAPLRDILAAGALSVEIARLRVEVRLQLQEVQASRVRIVEAGYEERRRLERDLHDGAQQRLVSLGLQIRRMQRSLPREASILAPALDQIVGEVGSAIGDLRQIAAGVRPARLDDGLAAALHDLARTLPIPVEVEAPIGRVAASVEAAAYFVVCEALTNTVKHASASRVALSATREDGTLHVCVSDDGVGGAHARRGSGLAGLGDRVSAHGGTLVIASPRGGGTRIEVAIPCGS